MCLSLCLECEMTGIQRCEILTQESSWFEIGKFHLKVKKHENQLAHLKQRVIKGGVLEGCWKLINEDDEKLGKWTVFFAHQVGKRMKI